MGAMQIKEQIRFSKNKKIHIKKVSKLDQKRKSVIINQPSNTDRQPKLLTFENNACIRCKSSADTIRTESKLSTIFMNDPALNPIDSNYIGNYEQTMKPSNARRKSGPCPVTTDFFQKIDRNNNRKSEILGKEDLIFIQNGSTKDQKTDHQFIAKSTFKLLSPTGNDKKTIDQNSKSEEKIIAKHRRVLSDGDAENLIGITYEGKSIKNFVQNIPSLQKKRKSLHIPKIDNIQIRLRATPKRLNKEQIQEEENAKSTKVLNLKSKAENEWTWRGKHGLLNSINSQNLF